MVDDLAAIRIDPVADRIGQTLRNDLIERLTPFGEPRYPRYRLSVQVQRSSQALAIQADTTITRYNLRIDVSFTLTDVETGAPKAFVSGYSSALTPNLRDRAAEVRAGLGCA